MAGTDFSIVLWVTLFLFTVWLGGRLFTMVRFPKILGFMVVGILFGPKNLDLVPYASDGTCDSLANPQTSPDGRMLASASAADNVSASGSGGYSLPCDEMSWERWVDGGHIINVWNFIGQSGVTLMIFESGMHIQFDKVAKVGKKASVVAVMGTALPLLSGLGLVQLLFDNDGYPWQGFAAGCAFAPTSVGISINLLEQSKMLNTMSGQTTLTAAFIDDVFSLVMLGVMTNIAAGNVSVGGIVLQIVCSFGFLAICVVLSLFVFKRLPNLLAYVPSSKYADTPPRDEIHLLTMFGTLALFTYITWAPELPIGSHLLGAFGAGMCFVNVPHSHHLWHTQVKTFVSWMMIMFFAGTVGFAVPDVRILFDPTNLGKGVLLGIGPVIFTKIVSGLFAPMNYRTLKQAQLARKASWATRFCQPQQLMVGMAMVARGEFAYLVADVAAKADVVGTPYKMMSTDVFASVMVGLVMATVFAPFAFRWALGVFERANPVTRSPTISGGVGRQAADNALLHTQDAPRGEPVQAITFGVRIAAKFHTGVHREILACFHDLGLDCLEANIHGVDDLHADSKLKRTPSGPKVDAFVGSYHVVARGKKKDFDDEMLGEMQHALTEVLDDEDAQVIFEPTDDDFSHDGIVEIHVIGEDHPDVLHKLTDKLAEVGLDVIRAQVDQAVDLSDIKISGEGTATLNACYNSMRKSSSPTPEEKMATKVFYAKEMEGLKKLTKERRHEIQEAMMEVLREHDLQGRVLVRTLHESEMPKEMLPLSSFKQQEEKVCVIQCSGAHHKDLLHEICDALFEAHLDVLHAEMTDTTQTYYVLQDPTPLDPDYCEELREKILNMYVAHGLGENAWVSVKPLQEVTGGQPLSDVEAEPSNTPRQVSIQMRK